MYHIINLTQNQIHDIPLDMKAKSPIIGSLSWFPKTFIDGCPLAAFGREHLLGERWLLGSNANNADGCWADICKMDSAKQELFLERVLFLHQLAVSRTTSSSQSVRLSLCQWEKEVEICCTAGYVLKAMAAHVDPDKNNAQVFDEKTIKQVKTRVIEGTLFL